MDNSFKKLDASDIKQRLSAITAPYPSETEVKVNEHDTILSSPYLDAAAVMISFKVDKINPVGPDFSMEINSNITSHNKLISELIGSSQIVIESGLNAPESKKELLSYCLRDTIRRQILERLFTQGMINKALEANAAVTLNNQNVLQSIFTQCLLGDVPKIEALNLDQLNSLCHISEWLAGLVTIPTRNQLRYRIQMMEMLSPFKHLTGRYLNGKFIDQFKGRRDKLSALRRYVSVAPPQGHFENIERLVRNTTVFESIFDLAKRPPLLVFGLGGVGKSTLLAKFILEHIEAQEQDRFPFVYLDFDRPNLSALEPETLLIEAARQLSIQYNDKAEFYKKATTFYETWKVIYTSVTDATNSDFVSIKTDSVTLQLVKDKEQIMTQFISLVENLSKVVPKSPFLMVLDTFEEVQYKGADFVEEMYYFMSRLQKKYPLLRTVVAGRAPITTFKTEQMELTDLDNEAAEAYLERLDGISEHEAKAIVQRVGGNPLTLKLAAQVVKDMGLEELKKTKLNERRFLLFDSKLSQLQVQGILYKRILGHIHNPNVRKLAYPGLILRVVSADIIFRVLNIPCELELSTIEEAAVLFYETAREVSLITLDGNLLRHRPDVRKVMLKLIMESKPETVEQIQKVAINYYSTLNSKQERAEEIYHRLLLGESPRIVEQRWIDGVQNFLMGSIDELPSRAQAYLYAKTGIDSFDDSVWENADIEDLERHAVRRTANLLNSGLTDKALDFISANNAINRSGILSLFEVKALSQLGKFEQALKKAEYIVKSSIYNMKPIVQKSLEDYVSKLNTYLKDEVSQTNQDQLKNIIRGNESDLGNITTGGPHYPPPPTGSSAPMESYEL